ncbi:Aminotransferase [Roseimaritima multifibrata]|uniref:Aminotransferase n=1 Tax=Roseimaritima multifibrata TaxID=1930274 RepID=A0A517MAB8_9BACT|nr:DegT/DnrJ/EryC1/StrS family aminotransferase [Roseimaritima multifibrata]QDS91791.1 Aminotransferase [Roseimaritima multifibrata]
MSDGTTSVPLLDVARGNTPLREAFLEALQEVVDSGRFLFGPDVTQLEEEIASFSQVDHAIGCASGSDALLLALLALNIGPGDEVIVPSFTFFASVSCITRVGATPVFVDIRPDTFNVDPAAIEAAITPRTKAIIPVHLFGQCAEIDRICKTAAQHNIPVIEDAAQSIGAAYHSRPAGSWGTVGCFSFYPTKNLGGMGDGGMLSANDPATADRLRLFAGHGMRPRYYHQVVGINSRLDSFQAAVLRVKFAQLPEAIRKRQANADRYSRLLKDVVDSDQIQSPVASENSYHVWNQYSIRVGGGRRDALRAFLSERNIGTEIYYPIPVHKQECYRNESFAKVSLPETDAACAEILNLPMFPELTEAEQQTVVKQIGEFYQQAGRVAA